MGKPRNVVGANCRLDRSAGQALLRPHAARTAIPCTISIGIEAKATMTSVFISAFILASATNCLASASSLGTIEPSDNDVEEGGLEVLTAAVLASNAA